MRGWMMRVLSPLMRYTTTRHWNVQSSDIDNIRSPFSFFSFYVTPFFLLFLKRAPLGLRDVFFIANVPVFICAYCIYIYNNEVEASSSSLTARLFLFFGLIYSLAKRAIFNGPFTTYFFSLSNKNKQKIIIIILRIFQQHIFCKMKKKSKVRV